MFLKMTVFVVASIVVIVVSSLMGPDYDAAVREFVAGLDEEQRVVAVCAEGEEPGVYFAEKISQESCYSSEHRGKLFILKRYDLRTEQTDCLMEFDCGDEIVEYYYGIEISTAGDDLILIGNNGYNSIQNGDNVVRFDPRTGKSEKICFASVIQRRNNLLKGLRRILVRDGGQGEISAEYVYHPIYYTLDGEEIVPDLYTGRIGNYPVVLELVREDEGREIFGSYYYRSQGPDKRIFLNGVVEGNGWTFWGRAEFDSGVPIETFSLTAYGNRLEGRWYYAEEGRELPVELVKQTR